MKRHQPHTVLCVCAFLLAQVIGGPGATATDPAPEPLHERVDRLIESAPTGLTNGLASDAEFLRRVSLDLTGLPPGLEDLRRFLGDTSSEKRARVVEQLLDSPLFDRHWATTLDVMLMERRPNVSVTADDWHAYLLRAVRENRPLNELISELLAADGVEPKHRTESRFYLDRASEPNVIARDVGRIFFGRDLQCAQCHNHPLVKDYLQSDYYGLLAFFSPGYAVTRTAGTKETLFFPEKAPADLAFDSVFVKGDSHLTGPRLPGEAEIAEPVFPPGEEYTVKPTDQTFPVPKYSRRVRLAALATSGTNRAFNENIANRLWAMMMGRGLVHPVDWHHPANPPSHPELLKLLGAEIAAGQFNVKPFLRQLALTRAYQRSIDLPRRLSGLAPPTAAELAEVESRSARLEEMAEKARQEFVHAVKEWNQIESALVPLAAAHDKAIAKHAQALKKEAEAQKAVATTLAGCETLSQVAKSVALAAARAQEAAALLPLEKDLANAAQKFVSRSQSVAAELAALEKKSEAQAAQLKKSIEELGGARQAVETARARMKPVRESLRQAEQVVLGKRTKLAEARTAVEHHRKQVELLDAYASRQALLGQTTSIAHTIMSGRDALVRVKKQSTDSAAEMRRVEDGANKAKALVAAAQKFQADCQLALERQRQNHKVVEAASIATQSACRELPMDLTLAEAAGKLEAKASELRSVLPELTARLASATASLQKASVLAASADRELEAAVLKRSRSDSAVTAAQSALESAETRQASLRTEIAAADEMLAGLLADQFALAQLKPLTPEQMCWSILKVTGVYDRYRRVEEAELAKLRPKNPAVLHDPTESRERLIEIERRTFTKLKGNVPSFIRIYGAVAGQPQNDFFATADQALFVSNGNSINGWITPADGNLSQQLFAEKDLQRAAETLYMTVLSRQPTREESVEVARLLSASAKEKPAAVQELVWGLITSAEFRFNH